MKWFEKGQIGFVFLYVLNPVVILFYQNCTPSHLTYAQASLDEENTIWHSTDLREPSSVDSDNGKPCPEINQICPR